MPSFVIMESASRTGEATDATDRGRINATDVRQP
jgi:hypothetical protein